MLSQVFTCTNTSCRINSFMGSYMSGMNICPGCAGSMSGSMIGGGTIAYAGYMSVYYASGSYSPAAAAIPPPPPLPKGLEEAVREDLEQALETVVEDLKAKLKVVSDLGSLHYDPDMMVQLRKIIQHLEEKTIPKLLETK